MGASLLRRLAADPRISELRVISRRELDFDHPKIESRVFEFDRILDHASFLQGDHFFCCLGSTLKKAGGLEAFKKIDKEYVLRLARLSAMQAVRGFSLVSSKGANLQSAFPYFRIKGELEDELSRIPFQALIIHRPGLLLGARANSDFRPLESMAQWGSRALGVLGIKTGATPISALVESMTEESFREEFGKRIVEKY